LLAIQQAHLRLPSAAIKLSRRKRLLQRQSRGQPQVNSLVIGKPKVGLLVKAGKHRARLKPCCPRGGRGDRIECDRLLRRTALQETAQRPDELSSEFRPFSGDVLLAGFGGKAVDDRSRVMLEVEREKLPAAIEFVEDQQYACITDRVLSVA
jgi:hypothetical protein